MLWSAPADRLSNWLCGACLVHFLTSKAGRVVTRDSTHLCACVAGVLHRLSWRLFRAAWLMPQGRLRSSTGSSTRSTTALRQACTGERTHVLRAVALGSMTQHCSTSCRQGGSGIATALVFKSYVSICLLLKTCRARKDAAEGAEVARLESISALKSEMAELKVSTSCRPSVIHTAHPTASCQPSCSPTLLACASSAVLALTLPGFLRPCHCSLSCRACRMRMPHSCPASRRPQRGSWRSSSRLLMLSSRSWRGQQSACRTSWRQRWSGQTGTAGSCRGERDQDELWARTPAVQGGQQLSFVTVSSPGVMAGCSRRQQGCRRQPAYARVRVCGCLQAGGRQGACCCTGGAQGQAANRYTGATRPAVSRAAQPTTTCLRVCVVHPALCVALRTAPCNLVHARS